MQTISRSFFYVKITNSITMQKDLKIMSRKAKNVSLNYTSKSSEVWKSQSLWRINKRSVIWDRCLVLDNVRHKLRFHYKWSKFCNCSISMKKKTYKIKVVHLYVCTHDVKTTWQRQVLMQEIYPYISHGSRGRHHPPTASNLLRLLYSTVRSSCRSPDSCDAKK